MNIENIIIKKIPTIIENNNNISKFDVDESSFVKNTVFLKKTLLLGGGGCKFWYSAGRIHKSIELDKEYLNKFDKIVGVSAGGLLGCLIISKCDLNIIKENAIKLINKNKSISLSILNCFDLLKTFFRENLPRNAYQLCSNILHIQTIKLYSCAVECFNVFSSNEDLIDKIFKGCHIPILSGGITNEGYIDRIFDRCKDNCCNSTNIEKIVNDDFEFISAFKTPNEAYILNSFKRGYDEK